MAMGKNCGLGLVRRTSSFGRKRIVILNEMDSEMIDTTPSKKRCQNNPIFSSDRSLLEALPPDILIRVLCGVEHDDLKRLVHVSKSIREAALIAKKCHFAYSTPKKVPAFHNPLNFEELSSSDFDEIEVPNAPKQSRVPRSRLTREKFADISVALFASDDEKEDQGWPRKSLFVELES